MKPRAGAASSKDQESGRLGRRFRPFFLLESPVRPSVNVNPKPVSCSTPSAFHSRFFCPLCPVPVPSGYNAIDGTTTCLMRQRIPHPDARANWTGSRSSEFHFAANALATRPPDRVCVLRLLPVPRTMLIVSYEDYWVFEENS
jgi:hypothetical protein